MITNATVLDGGGTPAATLDVRIEKGRIIALGHLTATAFDQVIDAKGLTLVPGFIDAHSHHDEGLLQQRDALAAVSQGITTIVCGQDGASEFPLADYFARLEAQPAAVNVASYAGHATIRLRVMGDNFRRVATTTEVEQMVSLLSEEMAAGALGLSTGLEYDPGIWSATSELLRLAQEAGRSGGRYISHMRSEDRDLWEALDELITIGRVAKLPVHVSHMKLAMRGLWGQGDKLIGILERARSEGVQVTADAYPYTMWQSTLTVLYPKRNFDDRKETEFILNQLAAPEDLVICDFALDSSYVGKNISEIAKLRGSDPATTLMALIAESQAKKASESVIGTSMSERDILAILRWPHTCIGTDGALEGSHPRSFGSFPRVLGRYVREQQILALEEAVRRMSSLPAWVFGFKDRGMIRPGMWADLVLFDPKTVTDHATMKQPRALSTGVKTVWVNGDIVFDEGKPTGKHPGLALTRTSPASNSQTGR
ncbi:MAG: amidohydrolase family protein [Verrucomicrobiia bacterium]